MQSRFRAVLTRIRVEFRDLVEVVLLPGLAAVMPWPLCFRIFQRAARWTWLYREATERAVQEASRLGWVSDPQQWAADRRLVTLVDHADHFLTRTRSSRWLGRYVEVHGEWPASEHRGLLLTFHWGAGMWALRHAPLAGLQAQMLVAAPKPSDFRGHSILFRYIRARIASIDLALGNPALDVSGNLRPALRALQRNQQVMAVIDVPADAHGASESVQLLGQRARIPRALLRFAVEQAIPVTVFATGIRLTDGHRFIKIQQLGVYTEVAPLGEALFKKLDELILETPVAWHFWGEAPRFFTKV
jgi:hypothetical protein